MEKSGKVWLKNNLPVVEESPKKVDTVSIRNLIDALVKVTGTVTGNIYVFAGAGKTQLVDIRDKDELLNKKRGNSCCGGNSGKSVFELVEEI